MIAAVTTSLTGADMPRVAAMLVVLAMIMWLARPRK